MEIKKFNEAMLNALGSMDLGTLSPMSHTMFHPLFDREWIARMVDVVDSMHENGIPMEDVATSMFGTANIRCQLFFLLLDLKSARIEKKIRQKLSNFFLNLLEIKAKRDPYGEQSNIIHSEQQIQLILQQPFQEATEDVARELGKLYTAAYHVTNGLYTDFYTDYGAENIGPYSLGDGKILVIKHFQDLNPIKLWETLDSPCNSITIYCIYEDVQFRCDAISCHSYYDGDTIKGLKKFLVLVDGQTLSFTKIQELRKKLEQLSVKQWEKLVSLPHKQLKQQGVKMRCYTLKKLFELAGMDWQPTPEMREAVQYKEWATKIWNPPATNEREYWHNVLNPERDYYG